jgi:hypothetical protein
MQQTGPTEKRLALAAWAIMLRERGWLIQPIADELGISRSYASCLILDPTGVKERARKDNYGGKCEVCGKATTGSGGPGTAPKRCVEHAILEHERRWNRASVIAAIQHWAAEHDGKPPLAEDFLYRQGGDRWKYPSAGSVYGRTRKGKNGVSSPFVYWADAIEAAGFPRPQVGHYERTPRIRARMSDAQVHAKHKSEMNPRYEEQADMREYIILADSEDGVWNQFGPIKAHNETAAIEKFVKDSGLSSGTFVAIPVARFEIRELREEIRYVAVPVGNKSS